jgi:predicted dienelactone hydrolase
MTYDPFIRGPFPGGVRSGTIVDQSRDGRHLPFEVWYPAGAQYTRQDLSAETQDAFAATTGAFVNGAIVWRTTEVRQAAVRDATLRPGTYPVVLFSHASGGFRRQSSFLCTHLASHGYVVAAVDHAGNTAEDFVALPPRESRTQAEAEAVMQRIVSARVPDLRFLLDSMLGGGVAAVAGAIDPARIGVIGWSIGGWAALATPEVDDRTGAIVALVPGGSSKPVPGVIPAKLTFGWRREVPTLLLAAEDDPFTPVEGIRELYKRTPSAKRMFILQGAGHYHFGDQIDDPGDCPADAAHDFTRGLALAHLDAALKQDAEARQFLEDAVAALRSRGVEAMEHAG